MKLKPKVNKSMADIADPEAIQKVRATDPNFSISKLFSPHMSKFVNYTNKTCISADISKLSRRLKIAPDLAILELLDEFYEAGLNPILAGGKLISYLKGDSFVDSTNDYDLYFTNEDELHKFRTYYRRRKKLSGEAKKPRLAIPNVQDFEDVDARMSTTASLKHVTEYLFKSKVIGANDEPITVKVQLIHKTSSCIEEIIENFDLRCCAIAYYKGTIHWIKGSIRDNRDKKLIMLTPRSDIKVLARVIKYCQKGYDIAIPDLIALSILTVDPLIIYNVAFAHDPQLIDMVTNRDSIFDRTLGYEDNMDPWTERLEEETPLGPWTGGTTPMPIRNFAQEALAEFPEPRNNLIRW